MQVSETIGNEAVFFLLSVFCGMGLVLVYDIFRIFRRIVTHGNAWVGIEDVLYWIFCTVAVFLLLYQKNDGMMRAFAFVGILFGGAIYHFIFSSFVVKLSVRILKTILRPFVKIGKKILLFLWKQLKKIYKAIKMGLCKL